MKGYHKTIFGTVLCIGGFLLMQHGQADISFAGTMIDNIEIYTAFRLFGEISFVAGDVVSLVGLGFLFTAWGKE